MYLQFYKPINQTLTTCDRQGYSQLNTTETFERKIYYWNRIICLFEGNDVGSYAYNSATSKVTLSFNM